VLIFGSNGIQCPTLLTQAENDSLGSFAESFFKALKCPKMLVRFSAAEGAGNHCEMQNRSLVNRKSLDWLDEQFLRRLQTADCEKLKNLLICGMTLRARSRDCSRLAEAPLS
jgi:hypothetical protein